MRMVPLTVRFGDEELLDYEEISPQRFYERLASDPQPPRTAAPPPERFAACYRELLEGDGYEHVLSLHLSEALSATVGSARLAAARVRRAGDGRRHAHGLDRAGAGRARHRAPRSSSRGPCELAALMGEAESFHRRSRLVFAFETLEFLQRNGRIGRGQALVGGLLGVRPLLDARRGRGRAARQGARPCAPAGGARAPRVRGHARRRAAARRDRARAGRADRERHRRARPQRAAAGARSSSWRRSAPVVGTNTGPGGAGLVWAHEPAPDRRCFAALQARPRLLAGLQIARSRAPARRARVRVQRRDRARRWPRLRHADLRPRRARARPAGGLLPALRARLAAHPARLRHPRSATARCSAPRCSRCSRSTSRAASGRRPRASSPRVAQASTTPPSCSRRSCSRPASRPSRA